MLPWVQDSNLSMEAPLLENRAAKAPFPIQAQSCLVPHTLEVWYQVEEVEILALVLLIPELPFGLVPNPSLDYPHIACIEELCDN